MISGQIMLQSFDATVVKAMQDDLDAQGQPTGERHAVKVLRFGDKDSGLAVVIVFTPEQFDTFADQMKREAALISVPVSVPQWLNRNGN